MNFMINKAKEPTVSDVKYTKGDLIWEATRRNQDYKDDYAAMLEMYKEIYRDDKALLNSLLHLSPTKADLSNLFPYKNIMIPIHEGAYRWAIRMVWRTEESIIPKAWVWKDPIIDIFEIKKETSSGIPVEAVHPYGYLDNSEQMITLNFYHRTQQKHDLFFRLTEQDINNSSNICIDKKYLGNNFLLSISPTASDKSIKEAVQKVRKLVLKDIKEEINSLKKKKELVCYPRDIKKYIGWLQKYDKIVDYLKKRNGIKSLIYEKGAVIVPKRFSFRALVPHGTPGEDHERIRTVYRDAYKYSVKLIQATPNIIFSPPKTSQI